MGREIIPFVPLVLAEGYSHGGNVRPDANRNPTAAPAMGTVAGHAPLPEQTSPSNALNGVIGPRAPSPRHHAIPTAGSRRWEPSAATTGTVRKRVTLRSTSSSPMPSTASEAMARAQLLLRFLPVAD